MYNCQFFSDDLQCFIFHFAEELENFIFAEFLVGDTVKTTRNNAFSIKSRTSCCNQNFAINVSLSAKRIPFLNFVKTKPNVR